MQAEERSPKFALAALVATAAACAASPSSPSVVIAPIGDPASASPRPVDTVPPLAPPMRQALDAAPTSIPHRADINWANKVHLIGYALEPEEAMPGEPLRVTLFWRCDGLFDGEGWRLSTYLQERSVVMDLEPRPGLSPLPPSVDDALPGLDGWETGRFYVDARSYRVPSHVDGELWVMAVVSKDDARLPVIAGPNDGLNRAIAARITPRR